MLRSTESWKMFIVVCGEVLLAGGCRRFCVKGRPEKEEVSEIISSCHVWALDSSYIVSSSKQGDSPYPRHRVVVVEASVSSSSLWTASRLYLANFAKAVVVSRDPCKLNSRAQKSPHRLEPEQGTASFLPANS